MILSKVTRLRRPIFQTALAAADAVAVCVALGLAVLARERVFVVDSGDAGPAGIPAFRLLLLAVTIILVHSGMGLYEIRRGWSATQLALSSMVGSLIACAFFLAGCYMTQDHSVSRLVLTMLMIQTAASSMLIRIGARELVRWCRKKGLGVKRVVVVGDDMVAGAIRRKIEENYHAGLVLAGQAIPRETVTESGGVLKGGSMSDVVSEIERVAPHRVLFTVDIVEHEELQHLAEFCLARQIEVLQAPRLYKHYPGLVSSHELLGIPFLGLGNHGLDGWELLMKNLVDRTMSALAIIVLSPLMTALAGILHWSTGGPVLRRSRRAGRGGVPFTLLSFETCRTRGGRHAITPVGSFLERFSLDGMPRLFNVLAGDMSFVGPRPDTPEGLLRLSGWQRSRLSVKPGLTGLAQVNLRSAQGDPTGMIQDDLAYIDMQSLLLDTKILVATTARTFGKAFGREAAQ